MVDFGRLQLACQAARQALVDRRTAEGHWEGRLSSSALSTATAVSALALARRHAPHDESPAARVRHEDLGKLVSAGVRWLAGAQNADGGWGDTDRSLSNIATTMLVQAAFRLARASEEHAELLRRADGYVQAQGGIAGLRRRYGRDKTFAVPILTNAALAGLVPWQEVSPLPFELACFPQSWFRFLRLPVVSYAVPALVAIGQARYFHRSPRNPLVRWWRSAAVEKSLRVLEQMQPESGGFLEATPLTSFVVMSLASIGQARHPVARRGLDFITNSVRDDGSWPIDTNLATWVTTLSLNALASGDERQAADAAARCVDWLLQCQYRDVHPYTGAAPGGWGWSDLSGSVPDADDTSSALLALARLARQRPQSDELAVSLIQAGALGVRWLLDLQNSDGGWPTFCRGWGKLPFDRSGCDLTAHAIRALDAWRPLLAGTPGINTNPKRKRGTPPAAAAIDRAIHAGFAYLARRQGSDGDWSPLWFGNQFHPQEANPLYGTARVLLAYADLGREHEPAARRAAAWLASQQRQDGAWGPEASVEETALAVEALLAVGDDSAYHRHIERGLQWLIEAVETGRLNQGAPIGFYFAKLWYYEALYPLIFTTAALGRAVRQWRPTQTETRGHRGSLLPESTSVEPSPASVCQPM